MKEFKSISFSIKKNITLGIAHIIGNTKQEKKALEELRKREREKENELRHQRQTLKSDILRSLEQANVTIDGMIDGLMEIICQECSINMLNNGLTELIRLSEQFGQDRELFLERLLEDEHLLLKSLFYTDPSQIISNYKPAKSSHLIYPVCAARANNIVLLRHYFEDLDSIDSIDACNICISCKKVVIAQNKELEALCDDTLRFYQEKNQRETQISCFKPYEIYLNDLDIKLEELCNPDHLKGKTASEILSEVIYSLILTMPLEEFDPKIKKACYEWVIYLLADQNPEHHPELLKLALTALLSVQDEESHYPQPSTKYDHLISHCNLWVWSEKSFREIYPKLQESYPDDLKAIDISQPIEIGTYQQCAREIFELLKKENVDLSQYLGKERNVLLHHFVPLYLGGKEANAEIVFERIQKYRFLLQLHDLYLCLEKSSFQGIFQHFCEKFSIELPLEEQIQLNIKTQDLILYKVAAILSFKEYWASKSGGKLRNGIQEFFDVCERFSADRNSLECLVALKKIAAFRLLKKSKLSFFDIPIIPIERSVEVGRLYQCIANLEPDQIAVFRGNKKPKLSFFETLLIPIQKSTELERSVNLELKELDSIFETVQEILGGIKKLYFPFVKRNEKPLEIDDSEKKFLSFDLQ